MYSDALIAPEQQKQWFQTMDADPLRRYLVFLQDKRPIGCLNFMDIQQDQCQWGCYIGEENIWPGSGLLLEIAALDYAFGELGMNILAAEVLEFNQTPQRMHEFFGYRHLDDKTEALYRDGRWYSACCYQYRKQEWLANREQVMRRLPKQIAEASMLISFQYK